MLCLCVQLATLIIVEGGQSEAVPRPLSLCGIALICQNSAGLP